MPSVSAPQHRFMEMIAHDPARAHQLGVPQSVGKDFVKADKNAGKHFTGKPGRHKLAKAMMRTCTL